MSICLNNLVNFSLVDKNFMPVLKALKVVNLNAIEDVTRSLTFSKLIIFRQKKDYSMTKSLNLGHSVDANSLADMSKSLAGFHLTAAGGAGNKAMHESTMDQVLHSGPVNRTVRLTETSSLNSLTGLPLIGLPVNRTPRPVHWTPRYPDSL